MLYQTLQRLDDTEKLVSWKSKSLTAEKFTTPTTTGNSVSLSTKWYGDSNFCLSFEGSCLKNATFTPPNRIYIFIVYGLDTWSWYLL